MRQEHGVPLSTPAAFDWFISLIEAQDPKFRFT
jgi:hypothetical protein